MSSEATHTATNSQRKTNWLGTVAPGILIAATGVGAGDLLTASLGGSIAGLAILWAAGVGAVLKWFLNEGIARWQMATGTTLLEGWIARLGAWIQWAFLLYLFMWSFVVGGALVNACGVAGTGLLPLSENVHASKIIWGVVHSLVGLALVWIGGFKVFERIMSVCIGVMFVAVVASAIMIGPDWEAAARGLVIPSIPPGSLAPVLGILGGVGGTLTLLSYGYWIREEGRTGTTGVRTCRIDLGLGYAMTAIFGLCMIVLGSRVELASDRGPLLAIDLAEQIALAAGTLGPVAKWIFLIGFWGAVFSSLLGVWQSVPYLFADFVFLRAKVKAKAKSNTDPPRDFTKTRPYRVYLVALATLPLPLLWGSVKEVQFAYAIFGAFFMPLLALTLLLMNNRRDWVGPRFANGWLTNAVLVVTLLFFAAIGGQKVWKLVASMFA